MSASPNQIPALPLRTLGKEGRLQTSTAWSSASHSRSANLRQCSHAEYHRSFCHQFDFHLKLLRAVRKLQKKIAGASREVRGRRHWAEEPKKHLAPLSKDAAAVGPPRRPLVRTPGPRLPPRAREAVSSRVICALATAVPLAVTGNHSRQCHQLESCDQCA